MWARRIANHQLHVNLNFLVHRNRTPTHALRFYTSSVRNQQQQQSKMSHVEHVLFFKLRTMTPEEYDDLHKCAMGLKEKIPGVLEISLGPHEHIGADRTGGYTHGFRVKFADVESLKVYSPHEEHQKFVAKLALLREAPPLCLDWLVKNN